MNNEITPIKQACVKAGGQAALAKMLNISASYVNQMVQGRRPVPPKYCIKIERELSISRKVMLPNQWAEIWPDLVDLEIVGSGNSSLMEVSAVDVFDRQVGGLLVVGKGDSLGVKRGDVCK